MQDTEAQMLSEKQAQIVQQSLQQASNIPAGQPNKARAKKATPKELQQAEVSAIEKESERTVLFEQNSQQELVVNPRFPSAEANERGVQRGGRGEGGVVFEGKGWDLAQLIRHQSL